MDVASAALAPTRGEEALAMGAQVGEKHLGRVVVHHGAGGHAQDHVLPALAVHVLISAALARRSVVFVAIAEIKQGRQTLIHF